MPCWRLRTDPFHLAAFTVNFPAIAPAPPGSSIDSSMPSSRADPGFETRGILITDLSTATDLGVNHESERPEPCWLTIKHRPSWYENAFRQPLVFCQSARSTGH